MINRIKSLFALVLIWFAGVVAAQQQTLQSVAPFKVGCAINPNLLAKNPSYQSVVTEEFNSITSENVLKFGAVHPQKEVYDFAKGDFLVAYAQMHHKRIHGHCLAWHQSVPKWLSEFEGDSAAWENLLRTHIRTVLTHYKGKMESWDVVNEAFFDNGTYRQDSVNAPHRHITFWRNHLGEDYIARAFEYAHEADPNALLFYNDYGQESNPAKLKAILAMVTDFKRRGIPIHGLGLQMHIGINTKDSGIAEAIKQMAATGLLVHISELDIKVNQKKDTAIIYTDSLKALQCRKFAFVVEQYKKLVPKKQQYGITFWNVGDGDSWIVKWEKIKDWPLLFDVNYRKKACYGYFYDALKE